MGSPSNPTSSFGTLPFSCAIVFIVSGTPPLFCSSTAYFRLTAMTTPRRTDEGEPAGCRFTTLWLRLFLLGHGRGRDRLTGALIRRHDIGLAPLNRVGVAKQPFILSANFNKGKVGREYRGDVRRAVLSSVPLPRSLVPGREGRERGRAPYSLLTRGAAAI